jgi:isopentenyldiphosphate isomerase
MTADDELVDVIDAADHVVRQAPRAEMRRTNLLHRAVYILVLNSAGHLFVRQRTTTRS